MVPVARRVSHKVVPVDTTQHHSNDTSLPSQEQHAGYPMLPNGAHVIQEAGPVELQPQVVEDEVLTPPAGIAEQNPATPRKG